MNEDYMVNLGRNRILSKGILFDTLLKYTTAWNHGKMDTLHKRVSILVFRRICYNLFIKEF